MKKTDGNIELIVGNKERVSELAAEHIYAQLQRNRGKLVLGAAGGSSTAGVYKSLCSFNTDISGITAFTADEYFGTCDQLESIKKQLPGANVYAPQAVLEAERVCIDSNERVYPPGSGHHSFITVVACDDDINLDIADETKRKKDFEESEKRYFEARHEPGVDWERLDLVHESASRYNGAMHRVAKELIKTINASCKEYEKQIADAGGIDIILLGLGADPDGHIASIMPGNLDVDDRTHLEKYLSPHKTSAGETNYAITMGIGTILEAKEIVLLAFGDKKADAVERALYGPINGECPASYLRKSPNRVLVCLDYDAAKNI